MSTMAALRAHERGGPEVLRYEHTPLPEVEDDEVLVAVHAAAITFAELTWDESWTHLPTIPSHEFSGVVVATGSAVDRWSAGDEVYGLVRFDRLGAAADYVTIPGADLAERPKEVTHVQAASLPLAALTVWQALFDHARIQRGERLLVTGAAGGVGLFGVQLGRHAGAHVTATIHGRDEEVVRELGAEAVIDRKAAELSGTYDVVLDTVGGAELEAAYDLLPRGGRLITLQAEPDEARAAAAGIEATFFVVEPDPEALAEIAALVDAGTVQPVVAATYPLEHGRRAFESGATHGRAPGKTVLIVRD